MERVSLTGAGWADRAGAAFIGPQARPLAEHLFAAPQFRQGTHVIGHRPQHQRRRLAFAFQAFEHAAVDYVLKPVQPDRLAQTVARLKAKLAERSAPQEMSVVRPKLRIASSRDTGELGPAARRAKDGEAPAS